MIEVTRKSGHDEQIAYSNKTDLKRKQTTEDTTTAATALLSLDCKSHHQISKRHKHVGSISMETRDLPPISRYQSQEERDCLEITREGPASPSTTPICSSDVRLRTSTPFSRSMQSKRLTSPSDVIVINRAASHELESAMALASLAHHIPTNSTTSASAMHRRHTYPSASSVVLPPSSHENIQRIHHYSTRIMEPSYMHPRDTSRYYATFPYRGHVPRPHLLSMNCPPHQPQHQHHPQPQHQWACDFCGQGSFLSYDDAFRHESLCPHNPQATIQNNSVSKPSNHYLSARSHSMTSVSSSSSTSKSALGSSDMTAESSPIDQDESKFFSGVIALAVPSADPEWLSELNCYIRMNCIQAFSAEQGEFTSVVLVCSCIP